MPRGSIAERTCRHWLGCMYYKCGAGLVPRDLAAGPALGWVLRVPCAGRHGRGGMVYNPCERYEPHTAEELATDEAELRRMMGRMDLLVPIMRRLKVENKGKDGSGVVECPICKGQLAWSISAYNGHVWLKCRTADCLMVME